MIFYKFLSNFYLAKSFFDKQQVSFLIFYVTNRCNFRCNFCFYHAEVEKGRKVDELTLEEIKRISENSGPIIQLSLTGGEPFLRDDLTEITEVFIKNNYARYITIPTNASLPERIVGYLEKVLPQNKCAYFRIVFSIDGIGKQHDLYRSCPGSYNKILDSYAAVSSLRKKYHNLVLDSNSVYTSNTEETILETLKTIKKEFDFDNISVTYARGGIKDTSLKESSFVKYMEMNDYLKNIKRTKEKRFFYPVWRGVRDVSREYLIRTVVNEEFVSPCVAGRKLLILGETGEVFPCEILKKGMGNVRDYGYDLKNLLSKHKNKELVKWINESKCKCSFECALAANVIWGKWAFLKIVKASIKNIGMN